MSPKTHVIAAGSAVLAFFVLTGFATTQGRHWGPRESDRARQVVTWHVDDKLEALRATSAQKQAVHALQEALFTDGEALYVEQDGANSRMLEYWGSHSPDPRLVHELVEQRMAAFNVYAHKAADAALELHRILTPEQRHQVEQELRENLNAR